MKIKKIIQRKYTYNKYIRNYKKYTLKKKIKSGSVFKFSLGPGPCAMSIAGA